MPLSCRHGVVVLLLAGIACASPPPVPMAPPEVEYAGCKVVLEPGSVCTLRSKRELRLWVRSRGSERIDLRIDGRLAAAAVTPVGAGQRFTLTVPAGAKRVDVLRQTRQGKAAWSLTLAPEPGRPGLEPVRSPAGRDVVGEVDEKTALVYRQLLARDLTAAQATLAALRLPPKAPAEARYLVSFYRGMLAEREGDYRSGLAEIQQAVEIAQRVKPERYLWLAEEELALLLRGVGRSREAALIFERLRRTPHAANACEEAQLLNNQAWSALLAREAGEPLADPTQLLQEALAKYDTCATAKPEQVVNALINLALAHLQAGRLAQAKGLLARAHGIEPHPPLLHALWWLDLEARIELADGRPSAALRRFGELSELAAETGSFDGRLRAAFGLAQAHQALAAPAEALAVLGRAEALLDEQSLQVPVNEGRETFLAARQSIVALHVELLLDQGRAAPALQVVRHARSRVLRQLAHGDFLASLSAAGRTERARVLTEYQQRRAALEERASDDWKLPADELRQERAARKTEAAAVEALLDEAFLIVAGLGKQLGEEPPPPRLGEVLLAYHPLSNRRWVGFAADGTGVEAHRFELAAAPLPTPEELAGRLLVPFRVRIERATRLRILASGALENVDFHALPFAGDVLLARWPVVYGLDLPLAVEARSPGQRALLVADPRLDLPGARDEVRTVRAILGSSSPPWVVEELAGGAASAAAVRADLATADLLHYAGHGSYAGLGGWESSLLLAEDTRLTLGDLLALDEVPAWVVLSGCDTGRSSDQTPVASLGLAHAFLLAGSRAVVASTRPADDLAVPAFLAELYRQWLHQPDLAVAMQRAQLAWRQDPRADWASFRLFVR